jgi:hypothetical protein
MEKGAIELVFPSFSKEFYGAAGQVSAYGQRGRDAGWAIQGGLIAPVMLNQVTIATPLRLHHGKASGISRAREFLRRPMRPLNRRAARIWLETIDEG